jgi:hypothetical protein
VAVRGEEMIDGGARRAASRREPSGEMIDGGARRAASRREPSGEMIGGC